MHYLFLDESYPPINSRKSIVMVAWAAQQDAFENYVTGIGLTLKRPSLASINAMFESIDALAVIARADLDDSIFRGGERDGTNDIADMARPDNIWSQGVVFLVGKLLKEMVGRNHQLDVIDIYHDPKTLKPDHAEALEKTLRNFVVPVAKQYSSKRRGQMHNRLEIRRIEAVAKPRSHNLDKYQLGTWIADRLCSCTADIIRAQGFSRIIAWDMSDIVRQTAQQFDGKAFHET